jgi:hypothetical protein
MSEQPVELVRRLFDEASRVKDPFGRGVDTLDRATVEARPGWIYTIGGGKVVRIEPTWTGTKRSRPPGSETSS